jgi:hypothetical protein
VQEQPRGPIPTNTAETVYKKPAVENAEAKRAPISRKKAGASEIARTCVMTRLKCKEKSPYCLFSSQREKRHHTTNERQKTKQQADGKGEGEESEKGRRRKMTQQRPTAKPTRQPVCQSLS